MSTSIQPEPQNQPPNPPEPQNQNQPGAEPAQPPAPNTTNPTNVSDLNLLAFREAERERQRLAEENQRLQERLNTEQRPQDYSSYNDRFLTEPATATAEITRNIVQEEIRKAFAPLQNDFTRMTKESTYRTLKDQARLAFPQFTQIESLVDQIMTNADPTAQNLQAAITMAIGQLAVQGRWNPNGNQNPAPAPAPIIPAQTNPSPPAPPRPNNAPQIQLNELQKRLARENNMTEEEFIKWMQMDEKDVVSSDLNKPK